MEARPHRKDDYPVIAMALPIDWFPYEKSQQIEMVGSQQVACSVLMSTALGTFVCSSEIFAVSHGLGLTGSLYNASLEIVGSDGALRGHAITSAGAEGEPRRGTKFQK